jgi:hypothetical protein
MKDHNRTLLVLFDSRQGNTCADVRPSLLAALEHWGVPYRGHDLAKGQPSAEELVGCAAVLIAQQNLCAALTDQAAQNIVEAVANGLGYVGCDGNIEYMPPPLQHMLAVQVQDVQPALGAQIVDARHYVSKWQVQGDRYYFKRPLEIACVKPTMPRVRALLESDGYLSMWVTRYGRGRVAQWALSPGVWRRQVFGHCEGLDDLLWRSIVWVARKPFAMLALPPFSTACVGDAIGAHDFAWIESMSRHGFPPNVGIFPDDIDAISEIRGHDNFFDRAVHAMRRCVELGMAEFSPHAATWNRSYLLYSRADGSEIPSEELRQRFAAVDKQFARYGISWARAVNPHYGQLGYNALPFLEARGVRFSLGGYLPGETWEGDHKLWQGGPYDHPGFTIAPLPRSPNFFVVVSGRSYDDAAVFTGPDTYHLRPDAYLRQTDFMWGRTRWQGQCRVDDWDAMAQAAVRQICLGLHSLFFASPATHEQTIAFVALQEWEALWKEIDRHTSNYERWPRCYSEVAAYARAKSRTRLTNAHFDGALLTCELEGNPDVPLYLYVWDDLGDDDGAVHHYEVIDPFDGSQRMVVS